MSLPLAALLIVAVASLGAQEAELHAVDEVAETMEERAHLAVLLGLLVDAETGVRGYLLTGKADWLEPYERAKLQLPAVRDRLDELIVNDTDQLKHNAALRSLVDRRLVLLSELRASPPADGGLSTALESLLEEGKAVSDEIRSQVAVMYDLEDEHLARARAAVDDAVRQGTQAVLGGVGAGVGGGVIAAVLLTAGIVSRTRRLEENARRLVRGEASFDMPEGRDEIGELGRTLTAASRLLAGRERVLRETRQFLEGLIETGPVVMFKLSLPDRTTRFVSPNVERMLGHRSDEIIDVPNWWRDHVHPDDLPRVQEVAARAHAARVPQWEVEWRFLRRDGRPRWVHSVVRPEYDSAGVPTGLLAYAFDIDDRKHAEDELRRSRAFLDSIVDNIPDMIFVKDAQDLRFVRLNRAGEELVGHAREEFVGKSDYDFFPAGEADFFTAKDREVLESGLVLDIPAEPIDTARRGQRILHTKKIPLYDAVGRPEYLLGISEDITERKQAEDELRAARLEAERANRTKSEFLSRMSHELRTPLNSVLGFAQLLDMDELTDEQRDNVKYISRAGRHLLDLINEVLDIRRIESGTLTMSLEAVALGDLVDEVVALVGPMADGHRLRVAAADTTCDQHVLADRQRLKQVLLNLVSNALKYNREGGMVKLGCHLASGRRLRIEVTDTGYGIAAQQLGRLFTPFERLGAEQGPIEGTGMGLALSKGLVEAMGGRIGAESTLDVGSTFWVELDLAEDPIKWDERSGARADPPVETRVLDHHLTVLYIEDNDANVKLIERVLTRRPNVELVTAIQGRLGLDLARQNRPDLVLLDLHLPDVTGFEVLRQLRARPETRRIPVIVVSADATKTQAARLIDAGAFGYLTKPLDVGEFLNLLDRALDGQEVSP